MTFPVRRATPADFDAITRQDGVSFGMQYDDDDLAEARSTIDLDRFLVATDAERVVGVAGDYPFDLTLPGGSLPVPGVTWVSVAPTHRRRGILRAMMDVQLRGYAEAGYGLAILTASEGGIYGRFGYGPTSLGRTIVIDRTKAALREPGDARAVRLLTNDEARTELPALHRVWHARTPGAVNRTASWWDRIFADRAGHRGGFTAMYHLVHDGGYVSFRLGQSTIDGRSTQTCRIVDYTPITPAGHAALWQVLLDMDLVGAVTSHRMPVDDPLPFLLRDGRQLKTINVEDGIWARLVDVPTALAARCYASGIDLVLDVRDPLLGDGKYRLQGGPDGATCVRTDAASDVSGDIDAWGSIYLGGFRARDLAAAGRLRADDPSVLDRLDRAFLADRAPVHGTSF